MNEPVFRTIEAMLPLNLLTAIPTNPFEDDLIQDFMKSLGRAR